MYNNREEVFSYLFKFRRTESLRDRSRPVAPLNLKRVVSPDLTPRRHSDNRDITPVL